MLDFQLQAFGADWKDVPLQALLEKEWASCETVTVVEDANAALMGELSFGSLSLPPVPATRSVDDRNVVVVLICIGTGVGTAVFVDGQLLVGARGLVEGGHLVVDNSPDARPCASGQTGALEAYVSGPSICARAREEAEKQAVASECASATTCEEVFAAAQRGDAVAVQVVEGTAAYLAIACISMARITDPLTFLFSGGVVTGAGPSFLALVEEEYRKRNWAIGDGAIPSFATTSLGDHAGALGAIAIAQPRVESE